MIIKMFVFAVITFVALVSVTLFAVGNPIQTCVWPNTCASDN